jgi:hypothetical protein
MFSGNSAAVIGLYTEGFDLTDILTAGYTGFPRC